MKVPTRHSALQQVVERLRRLLSLDPNQVGLKTMPSSSAHVSVDLGGLTFAVQWKGTSALAHVATAAEFVKRDAAELGSRALPLVAVPFMGPIGREYCQEIGVSWLDLSGNGRIVGPGIRVQIEGQPNLFKRPGRPASVFAPKSSRIARWLLLHPHIAMTQREIAQATDMDEGFTSRIVARLEESELVVRRPDGAIRLRDPNLLLNAWREDYDFSKHEIMKGHIAARSGTALLHHIQETLQTMRGDYAVTGSAAAWQSTHFSNFRTVITYVSDRLASDALEDLAFRQRGAGANTWLVVPADKGVFHGASDQDGVRCVHPVQIYLDLKAHLERADEAAEHLRGRFFEWSTVNG